MMECPVCHTDTSRVMHTDGPKRRRECGHCRHRWTTIEIPAAEVDAVRAAGKLARQLLEAMPEVSL